MAARRKLKLNPDQSARRGRAPSATAAEAAAETRTVRVREPIVGFNISARPGDTVELPLKVAERYVEKGIAVYAVSPVQEAVQLLHDLGCGVALPERPPDEVQAAVGAVRARTAEL